MTLVTEQDRELAYDTYIKNMKRQLADVLAKDSYRPGHLDVSRREMRDIIGPNGAKDWQVLLALISVLREELIAWGQQ
jgi:hypothetical protein